MRSSFFTIFMMQCVQVSHFHSRPLVILLCPPIIMDPQKVVSLTTNQEMMRSDQPIWHCHAWKRHQRGPITNTLRGSLRSMSQKNPHKDSESFTRIPEEKEKDFKDAPNKNHPRFCPIVLLESNYLMPHKIYISKVIVKNSPSFLDLSCTYISRD